MLFRRQSSKLFNSHLTSGSEPESLLQVESCPKSVSLRTGVVGGRNHLTSARYLTRTEGCIWCWTLLNVTERNGHFQVRIHLILSMMWKTARWHFYPTHGFFVHMNPQLGDPTEAPVFLCLCRFNFASTQDSVRLELSLPASKHGLLATGISLLLFNLQ